MVRLVPTETVVLPVSPGTIGYDTQKLVADKHCFKAPQQPAKQKLALIFSHSNGFNKETLHPMIDRIIKGLYSQDRFQAIDLCVYAWDARNHGDSARLNEGTFTETYTWFDNAMDTKQIIDYFDLSEKYDGIIGIGHSFGATSMILLESLFPKTFKGILAIEPVMLNNVFDAADRAQMPVLASLKRRDTWPDREACFKSLHGRSFWKTFHPEALENYVKYALYDTPEGTVKLKTPKEQEYHIFNVGYYANIVAYNSIRGLLSPIHFVYAEDSTFVSLDPDHLPSLNRKYVTAEIIPGTHMVPNETPDALVQPAIKLFDRVLNEAFTKSPLESKL
ncbi:unnamed protein product [Cunninghamella blakesleeana]